jgi:hypothetical protein
VQYHFFLYGYAMQPDDWWGLDGVTRFLNVTLSFIGPKELWVSEVEAVWISAAVTAYHVGLDSKARILMGLMARLVYVADGIQPIWFRSASTDGIIFETIHQYRWRDPAPQPGHELA